MDDYPIFGGRLPPGAKLLLAVNKRFKPVPHPFNMQNDGKMTYAEWQYQRGGDTIKCFAPKYKPHEMFEGKRVLDMGCGAAGKSLYYVSLGAERVVGVDMVQKYEREATDFAKKLGYGDKFLFLRASADSLPYPDGMFDTVIMNDFMEHVSNPEAALREAYRLLSPGGRIYINFPPYGHPWGAHLSDLIYVPWAHRFFGERALIAAYRERAKGLPDAADRLTLRFSYDERGREHITYINKMTLARFKKMLAALEITPVYYAEMPLRNWLKPLARFPLTRENFVRMGVCVIEKPLQDTATIPVSNGNKRRSAESSERDF
jgi:Methylase involved in ubiquinone/menaquinone biosynthesis